MSSPPTSISDLNKGVQQIHTDIVQNTIRNYRPNRILGTRPPRIDASEISLPRKARTTLAQLRSGWCNLLQNYKHRIDNEIADECPECLATPHDVQHLFQCAAKPTTLEPMDLWRNPTSVATYLQILEEEIDEND